ncbi:MAG: symmetrical bis(5'-nucleosyl)-tetraphosphatase [Dokdonella sp.]|uniref:symmetrical bis(5'-nucleosyl)-tetraphosphatase n=1 Tax=Dokdonella sp. TaxID=2291710 RepID=UPI0025BA0EF5|nr:symmetrical bis(5'-nucleosyl)-tetraphosphatase [Dokdonella sp.]MBX3701038.1 symmetrical bis(5'-nucleosyl)-tetraphosphatase [Dokdonella sp.]MCW5578368.1 symmetrical bis(5'-nucleosyl)-tetraphosphatase [Dokdonella sp.]
MATWAIGDVQGCHDELSRLIDTLAFDPARDTLWFCGDLVNRGGQSLAVLRLVKSLGERAVVVLGNHDLSLLAIAQRRREDQARVNAELREVLFADDHEELLGWLRTRKLVHVDRNLGYLLVHAGLFPRWSTQEAESIAGEIEDKLHGEGHRRLLKQMFGNKPDLWSPRLRGIDRWRAGINVFTRMRYVDPRGRIAFGAKGRPGTQRPGLYPWFSVPGVAERDLRVVCGHWSTLGRFAGLGVHALDTGCVWGGHLTAMRLDGEEPQYVALKSDRQPLPGKEID